MGEGVMIVRCVRMSWTLHAEISLGRKEQGVRRKCNICAVDPKERRERPSQL